jgi:protein MpaA
MSGVSGRCIWVWHLQSGGRRTAFVAGARDAVFQLRAQALTRRRITVGRSVEGRPLCVYLFGGSNASPTILLGGFHGDEPKGVRLANQLIGWLSDQVLQGSACDVIVVPVVNPDGYAVRKRRNARGVDLNRNFPTANWQRGDPRSRLFGGHKPASEPETRAVIRLLERYKPSRIVSIHSIDRHRFCNNYDGPARRLAEGMARHNGYPVKRAIGYPTPGSFGTWTGVERRIPVVTLELPSHHSVKRCIADNKMALLYAVFGGRSRCRA